MSYVQRAAESTIVKLEKMFGAVLVTGARQVGKSTLLEHHIGESKNATILTMDDVTVLESAKSDSKTFLALNKPPLLLDEIQKAPELFPYLKQEIDKTKGKGLFYMSGSEQFEMMENVTESLAGRVGILTLMGLSLRERLARQSKSSGEAGEKKRSVFLSPGRFVPTDERLADGLQGYPAPDIDELWKVIQRGSMPELAVNPDYDWSMFYGSYVRTYIERDVRKLTQVDDEIQFQTFMRVVASRTGQMLNISDIAKDVGIRDIKAKKWLSILQSSHLVYLLRPFYTNLTKRAVKTPKLYMTDTGLAAYLTRWPNHDVLQSGAMAGAFFESFIVGEVLKSYYNAGELDPPIYYYRDKDKREIDLIIMRDGKLHPLEIKKSLNPTIGDIRSFRVLDDIAGFSRGTGGIICPVDRLLPLGKQDRIIPVGCL